MLRIRVFSLIALLVVITVVIQAEFARSTGFTVNTTVDAVDVSPGNGVCATASGQCTLRAAIMETNALPGADTITMPAGTYALTIPGADENSGVTGDLDITDELTLSGAGAANTVVDGGGLDRVIEVRRPQMPSVGIRDMTVRNGNASGGGGIYSAGSLALSGVTISGNTATGVGGGIFNSGMLILSDATISGNAAGYGGGIDNNHGGPDPTMNGTVTATNVTVSGNAASAGGGGIENAWSATLINVTVTGNSAGGGGGIDSGPFSLGTTLKNSIVAMNTSGGNCTGTIASSGHNLEDANTCAFTSLGDLPNNDPKLGPLADNGGPTETHALLPGSPAIDAGDDATCAATDQRGISRPQGFACDIGAFELEGGGPPKRAVLFITGIASEGNCSGSGQLNGSLRQWQWLEAALTGTGVVTANPAFLYYVYTHGSEPETACTGQGASLAFDSSDSCWSLDDSYLGFLSLIGQGRRLYNFIAAYGLQHPNVELTIVAHSQGGDLAAYVAKNFALPANVKNIVTLDSPLQGIPWWITFGNIAGFSLVDAFKLFAGCSVIDPRMDSAGDMLSNTDFIKTLTAAGRPSTQLYTVDEAGQGDCVTVPLINQQVCGEFIPGSLTSASWATDHIQVQAGSHSKVADGTGNSAENQKVKDYVACAVRGLPTGFASCGAYANRTQATVQQGQTVQQSATVPSGASILAVSTQWPGSSVRTTLVSPSNRVIDASTTAPDVEHESGDTFESFAVTDPEPGEWTIELFGEDVEPGGEDVYVATSVLPDASADQDGDMIFDTFDNCAGEPNTSQADIDGDGPGDACDADSDNDTVPDSVDNCLLEPNADQQDANANGIGDLCDPALADFDGDGVLNGVDNCPLAENAGQEDEDSDGVGDACDLSAPGDVNCDGTVNSIDALQILRSVAGLSTTANCLADGDVNCDSSVNSIDALQVLRFIAGLPVSQPPQCPPLGASARRSGWR